jgi:hypothetical protein
VATVIFKVLICLRREHILVGIDVSGLRTGRLIKLQLQYQEEECSNQLSFLGYSALDETKLIGTEKVHPLLTLLQISAFSVETIKDSSENIGFFFVVVVFKTQSQHQIIKKHEVNFVYLEM